MDKYILNGKVPERCDDIQKWGEWYNKEDCQVNYTALKNDIEVSTVFLGLDHTIGDPQDKPILFETMIFGGEHDEYQERYKTWDEAEEGHKRAVKLCKTSNNK